jgi:hypothetical protein
VTPRRQKWKPSLDLLFQRAAATIDERDEPPVEAELAVLLPDQVDHGQIRLAVSAPETPPELLSEDRRAVRGP